MSRPSRLARRAAGCFAPRTERPSDGTSRASSASQRPAAAPGIPTMLVVTSRQRLWQRYGPAGLGAVEAAVGDLVEAVAARGRGAVLVYADDSPLLARLGVLPAETGQPAEVARVVRQTSARLAGLGEPVTDVLLLGDDGVVPFDRPANPSPDDEGELYSDQVYATEAAEPLRPVRAVGRLPDGGIEILLAGLRAAAAAHQRLAAGRPLPLALEAFGYSASVWKQAARSVFAAIGKPTGLRLSPPLTHREAPRPGSEGPRFRYFNLHGLVDSPSWFGQRDPAFPADYDPFPVALVPEDLVGAPGSLIFSEACYGAHLAGRAVHDSIALSSLAGGATAFLGATGVAYGGLDGRLVAADLLAYRFWEAILAGASVGRALSEAKWALVGEAQARQGYVDAEDEKAVANFVLYGDPSLVYHLPSPFAPAAEPGAGGGPASGAVESAGPVDLVGISPVRPLSPPGAKSTGGSEAGAGSADPAGSSVRSRALAHDLEQAVRQAVSRRLPEFATEDVRIELAAAPRRVWAKGAFVAADPALGPWVVTLAKSACTGEGPLCREVLRVTVDGRGNIRKLALSR